ncbi:hypothetical protein FRB94_009903 [Tulasnella sp. JGI-2019a]|nr:hypothetical protein FRB93_007915 [Tulasnella sp. JGI-2019a]KAG8994417.1 hypothetical protein FRB94_009903 [Tulasnella sp. JGI-2019a]
MDPTHVGPLDPFSLIPNEILIYILSLSTFVADPTQLASYLDRDTAFPFTALLICKRWRDIIHNTPEIWGVAAIVSRPEGSSKLMEHVRRCGNNPLDLSINMDMDVIGRHGFLSHLDRCHDRELLCKIKHVRMICQRKAFYSTVVDMWRVVDAFNRLGVELEGLEWIAIGSDGTPINRDNIASVFLRAFERQKRLRLLHLSGLRFFIQQRMQMDPRPLHKLEVFVLDDCDAYTIDILSYADMPVLHTLSITCSDIPCLDPTMPSVTLSTGIVRIPSVQRLTLVHIPTLQDLTKILSSVPNVKHLTLGGRWTLEAFDNEVEGFIGQLESLKVMDLSTKIDMPMMKSVVAARMGTLQEVTLDFGRGEVPDVEEMEEFKWLQKHVTLTLFAR